MAQVRLAALEAATRALGLARRAQRLLQAEYGLQLPLVQYVHTDECHVADGLMARLDAAHSDGRGQLTSHSPEARAAAEAIFKPPPPLGS